MNPRISPARTVLTAVAAFVTVLFALLGLAVDRATAGTGVCSDAAGCITNEWVVNGADQVSVFAHTNESATVEVSYHAIGSNVVKVQAESGNDPANHVATLVGLKQHTSYLYEVTAKGWDSSEHTVSGVFTTGTRTVVAKVQRVKVDYDGDYWTDGEIRAGIRVTGESAHRKIFSTQTIADGHSVYPNMTFTYKDVPGKMDMLVTLWEDDTTPGQLNTTGEDYFPTDSGSNSTADWTTAKTSIDVTKANDNGSPPVVVLAGDHDGLAFRTYVSVKVSVTF